MAVCRTTPPAPKTVRVPVRLFKADGVNVTESVQVAPAANVGGVKGHVDVCAKSPTVEMPVSVRGTVARLVNVMVFGALVVVMG